MVKKKARRQYETKYGTKSAPVVLGLILANSTTSLPKAAPQYCMRELDTHLLCTVSIEWVIMSRLAHAQPTDDEESAATCRMCSP